MDEQKSCSNCKHLYVDNLFYEFCCRLKGISPDLDEDGCFVENTKCKRWEEDNSA